MLGVGTTALIAHASGRKDRADANLIFNQSILFAFLLAMLTLVGGYAMASRYMGTLGADPATALAQAGYGVGSRVMRAIFLPAMALAFAAAPLAGQPWFELNHMWYLSVATGTLHAALSVWLLQPGFRRRLLPLA